MQINRTNFTIRSLIARCCLYGAAIALAQQSLTGWSPRADAQTGTQTGSHSTNGTMPGSAASSSPLGSSSPLDTISSPFPDTTRQKRNDERQRRIVSDTQKLVALTSLFKAEIADAGAETMSPQMVKQMEEIEKLAKSVKDKMRD